MNKLKIFAKHFHNLGFNITCITNYLTEVNFATKVMTKTPYHQWKHFEKERQSLEELLTYDWERATGLGLVLGYNKVRAIDIDSSNDESIVFEVLKILGLPKYYEWVIKSGSHNGYHIIVKADPHIYFTRRGKAFPSKEDAKHLFDKIEFRWFEHLVLPPSLHQSSLEYEFLYTNFPKEQPKWIDVKQVEEIVNKFIHFDLTEVYDSSERTNVELALVPATITSNTTIISQNELKNKFTYLVVDVETNGLPKSYKSSFYDSENWPEIIQIAWVMIDIEGRIQKKESYLILKEDYKLDNKININSVNAHIIGKPIKEVLQKFLLDCEVARGIVAHNVDFDLNVIQAEIVKYNLANKIAPLTQICTMKSSTNFCAISSSYGYKYPSLSELYNKLFSKEVLGLHNAETDVLATAKCFWKLKKLGIIK